MTFPVITNGKYGCIQTQDVCSLLLPTVLSEHAIDILTCSHDFTAFKKTVDGSFAFFSIKLICRHANQQAGA